MEHQKAKFCSPPLYFGESRNLKRLISPKTGEFSVDQANILAYICRYIGIGVCVSLLVTGN